MLAGCAPQRVAGGLRIGSIDADENATIAEIYATALERENIRVDRLLRIGDENAALGALERGEIDLYPGTVQGPRNGITSLTPSPGYDAACLVTSAYAAEQFWLIRMTKCAAIAPKLCLAATPDFLAPGGTLARLQRVYGGFDFGKVISSEPGEQLYAVNRGDADVANAMNTDSSISELQMVVLNDDKHFWPEQHIAPIVRVAVLRRYAQIVPVLNRVSRAITLYALQDLNARRRVLDMDARDAAEYFVWRNLSRR
jgi:osmoprotectant transport system substrate-binding protein